MADPTRDTLIEFLGPQNAQEALLALEPEENAPTGVFRVYASSPEYTVRTSRRPARKTAAQAVLRVRELLVFKNERMQRLSYPLGGQLRHRWLGSSGPAVIFPGRGGARVWLESPTVGVLEVQYVTCFDRWQVEAPCPVAIVATLGDAQDSLLLDPGLPLSGIWDEIISGDWSHEDWADKDQTTNLTVRVVNYCSGSGVSGADVWLDGAHRRTNSEGEATFEAVRPGSHSVRAAKPGYMATDEDTLDNERFTI